MFSLKYQLDEIVHQEIGKNVTIGVLEFSDKNIMNTKDILFLKPI